ncbi:farnesyl-diphosphate farnesyl transferas-like protein [Rhizodiscina lignyota]|uniref:Squalene synthase n=1 Tax=Rhizodiscina lignyota TaxID=1504668 RepID=A0A9P4INB3_9PEZI|nr:farnesyl-diphosphate farnesyl transferas-like protein [Rhizodiscina lignyota]
MPSLKSIAYYTFHPSELRSIIQWTVWHMPVHERDPTKESKELQRCFYFLDKTSRSFSAVIKELNPELLVPVCLFYLVLRGLDTIEDDMTIPLDSKCPELRAFHERLYQDGWTYDGNHAKEKDRDLLLEFSVVVTEFKKIKEPYQVIIKDIAKRMGEGMAESCQRTEKNPDWAITIKDYEMYCHYVAGLVGEGLTRLFVESKLANPMLLQRPDLHESMGQFLQQVNIIRDIREDFDDKRRFWPKEVWSKYVDNFEDLIKPENKDAAMNCSSEMILLGLNRVPECLHYLAGIRDQSVFNFAAIPQSMAIATCELCFRNPTMFERNIKITKGAACQLMVDSSQNLQVLCDVFKRYVKLIHKKNDPRDPNFLQISIACGKIEQFIETIFPTQKPGQKKELADTKNLSPEEAAKKQKEKEEDKWDMIYMGIAVGATLLFVTLMMVVVAWFAGARFDLAFAHLYSTLTGGNAPGPYPEKGAEPSPAHGEL